MFVYFYGKAIFLIFNHSKHPQKDEELSRGGRVICVRVRVSGKPYII